MSYQELAVILQQKQKHKMLPIKLICMTKHHAHSAPNTEETGNGYIIFCTN